jgi:hypothetical protein
MDYKDGDIFNWSWTDSKIKNMDLQQRAGTTYWCKSRFAIFNKDKEVFKDTYWSGQDDFKFYLEDINKDIELEFIANINELRPCEITEFNYYDNSDCINISHPNMTRSGRYIKKDANRSLDKMKRVVEAHLEHYKNEARYAAQEVVRMEEDLKNLTLESYVPCRDDVYVY